MARGSDECNFQIVKYYVKKAESGIIAELFIAV